jgi:hypothetical protein
MHRRHDGSTPMPALDDDPERHRQLLEAALMAATLFVKDPVSGHNLVGITWEYSIVALPRFEAPTAVRSPVGSPAVALLNREGELGWEAVGMTSLTDGTVAVLLKRPFDDVKPEEPA